MRPRTLTLLLLLAMTALAVFGCAAVAPGASDSAETVIVTDVIGREVEVPTAVDGVIAIGPGALRLVTYAGDIDAIVGVEQMDASSSTGRPYMLVYPQLAELPIIGQGGPNNAPDPEKILTVMPDVIFSTYTSDTSAADELEAKTGIPVVIINYGGPTFGTTSLFGDTVLDSLRLIGEIIGSTQKAEAAIEFLTQTQEDLDSRTNNIPDAEKPSVYVGGLGARGAHGIESTQGEYILLDAIHASNVVDETGESGSIMIDKEKLLDWDPDYIFIDQGGYESVVEDFRKNPVFYESLSAFQNGNIYSQLPYNYYSTNIGTAIADAYYIGTVVYPEAFADIDPELKADEIYEALLGKSVYTEMAEFFGGFQQLDLSE